MTKLKQFKTYICSIILFFLFAFVFIISPKSLILLPSALKTLFPVVIIASLKTLFPVVIVVIIAVILFCPQHIVKFSNESLLFVSSCFWVGISLLGVLYVNLRESTSFGWDTPLGLITWVIFASVPIAGYILRTLPGRNKQKNFALIVSNFLSVIGFVFGFIFAGLWFFKDPENWYRIVYVKAGIFISIWFSIGVGMFIILPLYYTVKETKSLTKGKKVFWNIFIILCLIIFYFFAMRVFSAPIILNSDNEFKASAEYNSSNIFIKSIDKTANRGINKSCTIALNDNTWDYPGRIILWESTCDENKDKWCSELPLNIFSNQEGQIFPRNFVIRTVWIQCNNSDGIFENSIWSRIDKVSKHNSQTSVPS